MKQKTRKILSRIGAGFMLGMSLFNFGAIWTRQQLGQAPRRTKNFKQKEQENIQQEEQEIANIAEKHAQEVLLSQQMQNEVLEQRESQQQIDMENNTIFQKFLKYAAVTVWIVSLGLIFSSVFMNYPISFGKGILSVIPNISNTAKIYLEPQEDFFQKNEVIKIGAFLEVGKYKIENIEMLIKFDPSKFEFNNLIDEKGGLFVSDVRRIDEKNGLVKLIVVTKNSSAQFKDKQKLVDLEFNAKGSVGKRDIQIVKEKSIVAARMKNQEEEKLFNVLGGVHGASFSVLSESGKDIRCGKLIVGDEKKEKETWENLLVETKLPKNALLWQQLDEDKFFVCGVDENNKLKLLIKSKDVLKKAEIFLGKNKERGYFEDSWKEDDYYMVPVTFNVNKELGLIDELDEVLIRFDGEYNWPKKGFAKLRF